MDKLIYADALMEYCLNQKTKTIDCNDIARFPIVDAVPVVRCRNCEYYNTTNCADGFGWCERNGNGHPATDDFYCANGEQKNEN